MPQHSTITTPAPGRSPAVAERRITGRVRRHIPFTWRWLGGPEDQSATGVVCDISRSGVAVRLSEAVRPGSVLSIKMDVPAAFRRDLCLIRVRHAKAQSEGDWLAGCSFVRRFAEAEFESLLRATTENAPEPVAISDPSVETETGAEFRRSLRKSSANLLAIRIKPVNLLRPESIGRLRDKSDGGLGIASVVAFPVGSVLNVRAESTDAGACIYGWVQLRVQHCRPQERQWLLGCRYVNKPEAQLLKQFEG